MTWQPADLLPSKVFRQYPHRFAAPPPRCEQILPGSDGTVATDAEHVQTLLAQARLLDECGLLSGGRRTCLLSTRTACACFLYVLPYCGVWLRVHCLDVLQQ